MSNIIGVRGLDKHLDEEVYVSPSQNIVYDFEDCEIKGKLVRDTRGRFLVCGVDNRFVDPEVHYCLEPRNTIYVIVNCNVDWLELYDVFRRYIVSDEVNKN